MEHGNALAIGEGIDPAAIDIVLNRSTALNPTSVVHFVRALCQARCRDALALSSAFSPCERHGISYVRLSLVDAFCRALHRIL